MRSMDTREEAKKKQYDHKMLERGNNYTTGHTITHSKLVWSKKPPRQSVCENVELAETFIGIIQLMRLQCLNIFSHMYILYYSVYGITDNLEEEEVQTKARVRNETR